MSKIFTSRILTFILLAALMSLSALVLIKPAQPQSVQAVQVESSHWFLLARKSNTEQLFYGVPGDQNQSTLIKTFKVKTGIPGQRPTPLPQLVGRQYWLLTDKIETTGDPETAPYFLTLDVPVSESEPYGPEPYLECEGQCNWIIAGDFGLHGTAGNELKLSSEDAGSSGCIRHSDEDITYLYNLLDPDQQEVRYYIEDV